MKMARALTLAFALVLFATSAAGARDLTGIYVKTYSNQVEFFNLTEVGGQLTGYYQIVSLNANASDGIARTNFSVGGATSGSRLILTLNGPASYSWTADLDWTGFVLNIPLQSGQITQVSFRRSSVNEVNRLVASLTETGNTAKYYANAESELADSQQRLSNDLNYHRPKVLDEMRKAKADLAKAKQEQQKANATLAEKKAIAAQKHSEADAARQSAQTSDEQQRASELETDARLADTDVRVAGTDVTVAGNNVDYAQRQLQSAREDLRQMDARIAQLRGIISRDKSILHIR